MRPFVVIALAPLCVVLACGGGEKGAVGNSTSATPAAGASTGAAATGASTGTATAGTPKPITGKTWDVKMIGDAQGYRFDPATLTIKSGDGVRWTVVSGQPHNVTFWQDSIPNTAVPVLQANMPTPMAPLTGPLLMNPSQTYTISFGGAPAGTYHFYCTPHLAFGMKGTITVQ